MDTISSAPVIDSDAATTAITVEKVAVNIVELPTATAEPITNGVHVATIETTPEKVKSSEDKHVNGINGVNGVAEDIQSVNEPSVAELTSTPAVPEPATVAVPKPAAAAVPEPAAAVSPPPTAVTSVEVVSEPVKAEEISVSVQETLAKIEETPIAAPEPAPRVIEPVVSVEPTVIVPEVAPRTTESVPAEQLPTASKPETTVEVATKSVEAEKLATVQEVTVEAVVKSSEPIVAPVEAAPATAAAPVAAAPVVAAPTAAAEKGPISLPDYLLKAVNDIAVDEGFSNFNVTLDSGANHGDGFIGEVIKVNISGQRTEKGVTYDKSQLVLIVKVPPQNEFRREMSKKLFEREVFMYTEVLPTFTRFQQDHGLRPGVAGFYEFPKCYKARFDVASNEIYIIMEDIREHGFKMESKYKPVEFAYAKLVLEKLGQFHAISLAMKQQRPDEFERFKVLSELIDYNDENQAKMLKTMTERGIDRAISILDPKETLLKDKVKRLGEKVFDESDRYKGSNCEPYAVINHGDCWINNIMFKFESGSERQICFLDWQISRYSSPILDIVYFIYLCTDTELRARYFDDLIQAYHHSLRAQLERLNADFNELFPLTAMIRQLKQYGRFAFGMSLMVVPMLCTDNSDIPDLNELADKMKNDSLEEFTTTEKSQTSYAKRMGGILRDMHKRGYF